jgi:hypothetical protein
MPGEQALGAEVAGLVVADAVEFLVATVSLEMSASSGAEVCSLKASS